MMFFVLSISLPKIIFPCVRIEPKMPFKQGFLENPFSPSRNTTFCPVLGLNGPFVAPSISFMPVFLIFLSQISPTITIWWNSRHYVPIIPLPNVVVRFYILHAFLRVIWLEEPQTSFETVLWPLTVVPFTPECHCSYMPIISFAAVQIRYNLLYFIQESLLFIVYCVSNVHEAGSFKKEFYRHFRLHVISSPWLSQFWEYKALLCLKW